MAVKQSFGLPVTPWHAWGAGPWNGAPEASTRWSAVTQPPGTSTGIRTSSFVSSTDSWRLDVLYQDSFLRLEVLDRGRGGPVSGSGHGLIGMRERATMYGGRVEAGPLLDGRGFRVVAVFPLTPAEFAPAESES